MSEEPEARRDLTRGHRARLGVRQAIHFQGDTLFDRVGRTVCKAACLPRKELYESWEMARRVRRRFRGGRIVDLAAGHGLLGALLLLLDDKSPSVVAIDRRLPASASRLLGALQEEWPRLTGRIALVEGDLDAVEVSQGDLVVSAHACGPLTDRILARAIAARARVAVLPCCHHLTPQGRSGLEGWLDGALAMDVERAARLERADYRVHTARIPAEITPKNRLLFGEPLGPAPMDDDPRSP